MSLRSLIACVGAAAVVSAASAQRLNLDAAAEPRPGDGRAALALADLLEAEASEAPGLGKAGRALRRLGADLLRKGEFAGQGGSAAVLAGLTIATERDRLDAQLAGADGAIGAYVESVASGGTVSVESREIDLLLRDALGPLAEGDAAGCGWWSDLGADGAARIAERTAALRPLVEHRRVRDEAGAALAGLLDTLELAPARPAYHRAAVAWLDLLEGAAGALEEPAAWLGMDARDRLREDLSSGLALYLDDPDRARALLGRTAALVGIVRACDGLEGAAQSRELREAVERLVNAPEHDPLREPEAVLRIAAALGRAVDLLDAEPRLPEPAGLVRQVRPMLGPLAEAHRLAGAAMVRQLPTMLARPDPMTEPGVIAAMNSLARSARDLAMPARISRALVWWPERAADPGRAPSEPAPARAVAPVAEQVRSLGVALSRPAEAPDALARLRAIDDIADALLEMPGESALRSASPSTPWRLVTGGQEPRLVFVIEEARRSWVRSHSSDQFVADRAADTARIGALAGALAVLEQGVALEALLLAWNRDIPPTINRWAAWETSRSAADALAEGLRPRLSELASVIARADEAPRAAEIAGAIRRDHGAALLLGALELAAGDRSVSGCSPAAQLALGPPLPGAWLLEHREGLARVCRAAFEAGAAEGEARAGFIAHANRSAMPVLEASSRR